MAAGALIFVTIRNIRANCKLEEMKQKEAHRQSKLEGLRSAKAKTPRVEHLINPSDDILDDDVITNYNDREDEKKDRVLMQAMDAFHELKMILTEEESAHLDLQAKKILEHKSNWAKAAPGQESNPRQYRKFKTDYHTDGYKFLESVHSTIEDLAHQYNSPEHLLTSRRKRGLGRRR